jgi:hypothetical protein
MRFLHVDVKAPLQDAENLKFLMIMPLAAPVPAAGCLKNAEGDEGILERDLLMDRLILG